MTKKELSNYSQINREIKNIQEKIEYYEEKKTSIKSQIISDMPKNSTGGKDKLGTILVEIEKLLDLYYVKQAKLIKLQIEIENVIDDLEDSIDRNIIRLRYFDNCTWEKICVELSYSWNGIHKRHRKILYKIR